MRLPSDGAYVTTRMPYRRLAAEDASKGIVPSACVSVTVKGGKACAGFPLIGNVCLPAPGVPNLGKVSGCCSLKKRWGIPTGIKCCIKYQGTDIACKSFGL